MLVDKLKENRLRYPKVIRYEEWNQRELKRGRGRPKMTWLEGVRKDTKQLDLCEDEVFDRKGWRRKICVSDYAESSF